LYDLATDRVRTELALKVPGMAGLYAMMEGAALDQIVGSSLESLFPGGLLPPAEMEFKGLKEEYSLAWEKFNAGDKEAKSEFFDDHPEYSARMALRNDPEERMEQFLRSEIWDAYGEFESKTDKKTAVAYLGPKFQSFLSSDPGVSFNTEQLVTWVRQLKGMVPETEETAPLLEKPVPEIQYYDESVTEVTDAFFEGRTENYPNYFNLQQTYYSLPRSEQSLFLTQFPELKEYWGWKDKWYRNYPDLKKILNSEEFRRVDTSTWSPMLLDTVRYAAMTGESIPTGAQSLLHQVWMNEGQPYDEFDNWLKNMVLPGIMNELEMGISQ